MIPLELLGWISTIVILSSFLFDGLLLRIINSIGCMGWLVYGIISGVNSLIIVNGIIVLIHLIKIVVEITKKYKEDKRRDDWMSSL